MAKVQDALSKAMPKKPQSPRVLARKPREADQGHSARRLNALAKNMPSCTRYLEIGVAQGLTLEQVHVASKIGVDPTPQFDTQKLPRGVTFHQMESDSFFSHQAANETFDLIFLDGLHEWKQTYKDLINALHHCTPNSVILVDDVIPDDELSAFPDWDEALAMKDAAGIFDGRWQGNVFKVLLAISEFHPELHFQVIGQRDRSDNPQAIVWTRSQVDPRSIHAVSDSKFQHIDALAYSDVFGTDNFTAVFEAIPEDEGFALLRA